MGDDKKNFYDQELKINITLASQMQLINILNKMISLNIQYPIDSPQKQKTYLDLVMQYLICGTPYLSDTDVSKYEKDLLDCNIDKKATVKNGKQVFTYSFNQALNKKLIKMMIELQQKLRRVFAKIKDEDEDDGL